MTPDERLTWFLVAIRLVRQEQGGWVVETSTISTKAPQKVTQTLIAGF